jgi:bisphosphoglycerate-dependent phosphoglycerate mutase
MFSVIYTSDVIRSSSTELIVLESLEDGEIKQKQNKTNILDDNELNITSFIYGSDKFY